MTIHGLDTRAIFDSVVGHSRGYSMGSLWQSLNVDVSTLDVSFEVCTELFILFLREQMSAGAMRLALNGAFLTGSIDEQLALLQRVWPSADSGGEDEMYFWFLADAPAGVVWIDPDGVETWT